MLEFLVKKETFQRFQHKRIITIIQFLKKINCRPRATFFGVESSNINRKEDSKRFLSLNGSWKFHFVKDPKQRPTTFQHVTYDDSHWGEIKVPANWETEGFDHPIYLD